ncbi:MAG: glycosyltransferase [Clostridia bacterium]|nr:glycosyltransferase [Clostridia bacterium]
MPQPKVSIIVPVYNVEKYLERCINSLRNQTLEDIEIILVDDSSTDSSLALCERAAESDSRIRVIHKMNEGAGKARNTALEIATGEYIGFVDSDDFVESDMFETLYEKAKKYGSDLVMSGVLFVDGNMFSSEGECVRKTYFENDTHFETAESLKNLRMGIVGAMPGDAEDSKYGMSIWKNLFRHEVIKKNNILFESEREMLSEDALFMIDYISCIKKATGIDGAFYNYCRNEDSISKSYKKDRFEKSQVFVSEVEKRFEKDIEPKIYRIYIYRFWQAMCRVLCSQEIMFAAENGIKFADLKKRLKAVCTHSLTVSALKSYPIGTLPLKQRVFAYAMKYKLYFLLKILVGLRSR